jgi:hypothetical protein
MANNPLIPPLSTPHSPEGANYIIETTISEALTRQVIHDANQFPQCRKW